jgi:hypothetical protein
MLFGQLAGDLNGSSVEGTLAWWDRGGWVSSSMATDEGCVEGEYVVVAVAVLVVCDFEEGTDVRAGACFWLCGMLWRLLEDLLGEPALPGDEGELRLFGELPLVTRIVVRLSSLLPLLELG